MKCQDIPFEKKKNNKKQKKLLYTAVVIGALRFKNRIDKFSKEELCFLCKYIVSVKTLCNRSEMRAH